MQEDTEKRGPGRPKKYEKGLSKGTKRGAPILNTRLEPDCYEWLESKGKDKRKVLEALIRAARGAENA